MCTLQFHDLNSVSHNYIMLCMQLTFCEKYRTIKCKIIRCAGPSVTL